MTLTRREQFAMATMQGLLANGKGWFDADAQRAVRAADALIAELDKAPANGDGFVQWEGGSCPVMEDYKVEVRFRDGTSDCGKAGIFYWYNDGDQADITAYRIVGATA